jgi:hypothetical protein
MSQARTDQEVVARTMSHEWTRKSASRLFRLGNIIRGVSVFLLISHAISMLDGSESKRVTWTLLGFSVLQWFDILTRYPLSVKEPEQRRGVIVFAVLYVVLITLYTRSRFGNALTCAVFLLLAVLTAVFIRTTHPFKSVGDSGATSNDTRK